MSNIRQYAKNTERDRKMKRKTKEQKKKKQKKKNKKYIYQRNKDQNTKRTISFYMISYHSYVFWRVFTNSKNVYPQYHHQALDKL